MVALFATDAGHVPAGWWVYQHLTPDNHNIFVFGVEYLSLEDEHTLFHMVLREMKSQHELLHDRYYRVCYACWVSARRNVQRATSTHLNSRNICIACSTSTVRRRTHLLQDGPVKDVISRRIYPRQVSRIHEI